MISIRVCNIKTALGFLVLSGTGLMLANFILVMLFHFPISSFFEFGSAKFDFFSIVLWLAFLGAKIVLFPIFLIVYLLIMSKIAEVFIK